MNMETWYAMLQKPVWAPPSWLFGPVWSVLYVIIAVSFGYVFYLFLKRDLPFLVALPFILNLLFNAAFTPLQFWLQNNLLALIDVILVVGTLIWAMVSVWPYARWVAIVNIPYLLWGSFATALQATITYMNW